QAYRNKTPPPRSWTVFVVSILRRIRTSTSPDLNEYIDGIADRRDSNNRATVEMTCPLEVNMEPDEPKFTFSPESPYATFHLEIFESWVASDLEEWLAANIARPATAGVLRNLMEDYHGAAVTHYDGNPEALSLMVLTILELWIALDMSAIRLCTLFEDYDPEVPLTLLENLNLPLKRQMERLKEVEKYLENRSSRSRFHSCGVLCTVDDTNCFPVRYFDQSEEHQYLFRKITDKATRDREAKLVEFREKKRQYEDVIERSSCLSHDYRRYLHPTNGLQVEAHSARCYKCGMQSQANDITIEVYELPLSDDESRAKSTVFALRAPLSFGNWRDSTVFLLSDVLRSTYEDKRSPRASHTLNDPEVSLQKYFSRFRQTQRIALLSEDCPHKGSRRKIANVVSETEDEICVKNGLLFRYHDRQTNSFSRNFQPTQDLARLCTYTIPGGREPSPFQQFVHRPAEAPSGPPPNKVLATQSTCPSGLAMEEYKALATLPLDNKIQWQNMLVQLASPSVDFKTEATVLVALQCILQAGPCGDDGDVRRSSHTILADGQFAGTLLNSLQEALERVEKNWQSFPALGLFVTIARRLFSLTPAGTMQARSLEFLSSCRLTARKWIDDLEEELQIATDESVRDNLRSKAVNVALVCADTFSVEDVQLRDILAVPEEACTLIQCAIVANEGLHCTPETPLTSIMIIR
ncbi:hypothetical protein GGR52DRAFT_587255, partial [Hypoxylon sp. FL1284]